MLSNVIFYLLLFIIKSSGLLSAVVGIEKEPVSAVVGGSKKTEYRQNNNLYTTKVT